MCTVTGKKKHSHHWFSIDFMSYYYLFKTRLCWVNLSKLIDFFLFSVLSVSWRLALTRRYIMFLSYTIIMCVVFVLRLSCVLGEYRRWLVLIPETKRERRMCETRKMAWITKDLTLVAIVWMRHTGWKHNQILDRCVYKTHFNYNWLMEVEHIYHLYKCKS